jgi:hypothetical protein
MFFAKSIPRNATAMSYLLSVRAQNLDQEGRAVHPIKWKAKYGGLDVSDARRLRLLEAENAKLKKLLAESMLDNAMLKDIAAKNGDARRTTRGRGSPAARLWGEPAAGVPDHWSGPQLSSLSQPPAG